MLITHLRLENFKSYVEERITFQPGTNAIIGANGAGKSSILEAIGFVLFDYRGAGLASRLREGADSCRVVLGLVSSYDEREYEIERRFNERTTLRYRVHDVELEQVVAEGNEEVQGWIHEHLQIEPTAALDTLFENTIGVPQGTFTAPFLLPPSQRKGVFDPLLQVDDYHKASDRLRDTVRFLNEETSTLREAMARLEERLLALPGLYTEAEALRDSVHTLTARSLALREDLDAAVEALTALDKAEVAVRATEARWERARAMAEAQRSMLAAAHEAVAEAQRARDVVARTREGYEAYAREEERLDVLEAQRAARDRLRQEHARVAEERARTVERQARLAEALEGVAAAAARMVELAPRVAQQASLERSLAEAEAAARDLETARHQESLAAEEWRRAQATREALAGRMAEGAALEADLERLRARREQTVARERAAQQEHAAAQAERARLERQSAALADAALARCPVCEGELTPEHRAALLARNEHEMAALAQRIQDCSRTLNDCTRALRDCEREANALQRRLRALPSAEDLARAEAEEARRRTTLEERRGDVRALAGVPERVEALRAELAAWGDPRREYQRCEDQVAQREDLEAQEAATRAADSAAWRRLEALEDALREHEGLDAALSAARAARERYRADHDAYLAHETTARQYEARRAKEAALVADVEARVAEEERLAEAHQLALAAYDAQEHTAVRARVDGVRQELAGCTAQLSERRARLETVEAEVARLHEVEKELAAHRDRTDALQWLTRTVETIREWLRLAGPYVTRQLVLQISREASAFYGDIMADHSGRLQWSEDYEVMLEVKGQQRSFRQFSGGEQMVAALAIRLALLREISAVDIAFFDEPTAHLDPERRESLAERIMQVKGLAQMFVISHDDTFERAAQSYIRIVKDERGSHPEPA
jgi:exonuclease SbcC